MTQRQPALRCLHHWPTRTLCIFTIVLQAISINWYLMSELSYTWAGIYGADAVVLALFIIGMLLSTSIIHTEKRLHDLDFDDLRHMPFIYIAWFCYTVLLDIKVIVIFKTFSTDLDEIYFFGPNTLKTTIALSGIVFLSFLATQHDLRHGPRKELMVSLTGTVIFDILDGVDILEHLFDKDIRDTYPPGLDDAIIAFFCINLILPTVPLFTLAKTKFGLRKLPKKLELFHKLSIAYLINLPLLIMRMITWHGLSQGISIFSLKNVIAMGVVTFEVLEHHFVQDGSGEKHDEVATESYPVDNFHNNRSYKPSLRDTTI